MTKNKFRTNEASRVQSCIPIFPSLRDLFFVVVPLGSRSHFQLPTRSYLSGSPDDELAWAKSTVRRTCVSTRDLVPPSGMLGTIIGRLCGNISNRYSW